MLKDPNSLGDVKLNGGDITFDDHGNALCVTKTVLGPNLPNVTKTQVFDDSCYITGKSNLVPRTQPKNVRVRTSGGITSGRNTARTGLENIQQNGARIHKEQEDQVNKIAEEYLEERKLDLIRMNKLKGI